MDYAFGSFSGGKSGRGTSQMGPNGDVFSDDVSGFRTDSRPGARSAFDQTNSTALGGNLGVGRPGSDGLGQNSVKTKKPNGGNPLGSFAAVCDFTNGGKTDTVPTIVPLTFPNIAHEYWDNYRLTGDYYLPESKGRD